jgi:hypothetical protein
MWDDVQHDLVMLEIWETMWMVYGHINVLHIENFVLQHSR